MTKTYTLELKFVLTDEQQEQVVETARRVYTEGSPSISYDADIPRELSAEEFIDGPGSALLHLLDQNAVLEELDINANEVSYTDPDHEADDGDAVIEGLGEDSAARVNGPMSDDDDLDELEEGLYLCRWPNGEFSVVKADTKREALVELDQWAGGEAEWLVPLDNFMVDFRLDDSGTTELNEFGEQTHNFVREHCYPELEAVLASAGIKSDRGNYSPVEKEIVKKAVERERTRLWNGGIEGVPAKTELGKRIQKSMGTTGAVADHYVKVAAKRILESDAGEDEKPN
jgi:hypothetical protein